MLASAWLGDGSCRHAQQPAGVSRQLSPYTPSGQLRMLACRGGRRRGARHRSAPPAPAPSPSLADRNAPPARRTACPQTQAAGPPCQAPAWRPAPHQQLQARPWEVLCCRAGRRLGASPAGACRALPPCFACSASSSLRPQGSSCLPAREGAAGRQAGRWHRADAARRSVSNRLHWFQRG